MIATRAGGGAAVMVQRMEKRGTLVLALALALVGGAEATGRQIAGCVSTGDNKCFDNYKYTAHDGSTCHDYLSGRSCNSSSSYGFSSDQHTELLENCPHACGICRDFDGCTDDSSFRDYFNYPCSGWRSDNCTLAHSDYDYSDIHEQLLLAKCPLACNICADRSDPACLFPFVWDGVKHHASVARNGQQQCMTRQQGWKAVVPAGTPCVFPFVHAGVRYTGCTDADTPHGDFAWCPTKVDPDTLGTVPGHWAVCQGCNLAAKLTVDDCVATHSPTSAPTTYESTQGMGGGQEDHSNQQDDTDRTDDDNHHSDQQDDTQGDDHNDNGMGDQEDGMDDQEDGMGDQEDGMGDQEDGMDDQEDGMGDDGMDRMRHRRSSSAESYSRPRWYTCAAQRYWEARPTTTLRTNIRIFDQSEGAAPAKTTWQNFVDNKPALGLTVLALVTAIVGGVYVGVARYRRHNQYPSGWKRLKSKLNQYGAADDPFDG